MCLVHHFVCARVRNRRPGSQEDGLCQVHHFVYACVEPQTWLTEDRRWVCLRRTILRAGKYRTAYPARRAQVASGDHFVAGWMGLCWTAKSALPGVSNAVPLSKAKGGSFTKDHGSQDLNNARFKSNGSLGGVAQKRMELCQAIPSNTQGWSHTEGGGSKQSCPCQCSGVELDKRSCAKPSPRAVKGEVDQKRVELIQAVPLSSQRWRRTEGAAEPSCPVANEGRRCTEGGAAEQSCPLENQG